MYKKIAVFLSCLFLLFPSPLYASDELYIGGDSIGIQVDYDGILVSGTYAFQANNKTYQPTKDLRAKDIITEVNGVRVRTLEELYAQINLYQKETNAVPITILRDAKSMKVSLTTVFDQDQNAFKTGLYVKDKIVGVGTLTYYDPSNSSYGALGHEIMDSDINEIALIHNGSIFPASVKSIQKAQENAPGEKHAQIDYQHPFGDVQKNTNIGIYGKYLYLPRNAVAMPWAKVSEVKIGSAIIYTALHGQRIEAFTIDITKVNAQTSSGVKGIEFKVSDPSLLNQTNGIIQGMSGSPIIQNGKIIGAVTHVITSNPVKGYGVYVEWMLDMSKDVK